MSGETVADDGCDRVYSFRLEEWRDGHETVLRPYRGSAWAQPGFRTAYAVGYCLSPYGL
jgi:hypothetical protein